MTPPPSTAERTVSILCLAVVLAAAVAAGGSTAAPAAGPDDYVAVQGDACVALQALGDGSTNVSEFYDYRPTSAGQFSSHGTTDLQASQVSQVFVYHGADGDSLVFLHDSAAEDGSGGGITMDVTGLPANGTWVVEDDSYDNGTDDNWNHDATASTIDWMWSPGRTDGGVFQGLDRLGNDSTVTVAAAFGEASYAHTDRGWPWATNETEWFARYGGGDDQLARLDRDATLSVERGTCSGSRPIADLSATPEAVGIDESVTLDATLSYDDDRIEAYRWDLDGDGTVEDNSTDRATIEHEYTARGEVTPAVTVVDADGSTDTATASVTVEDRSAPDARASANRTTVGVGDPVRFDGSNSTDDVGVSGYHWTLENGTKATGAAVTHRFEEPGDHEVTLTATDDAGNEAETTLTVTVRDETPPTAHVDPPSSVTAGESATFDGSASADDVGVTSYTWAFGDGASASGQSVEHAYSANGTYDVTLTVTDAAGNENATTVPVTVDPAPDDGDDGDDGSDGDDGDDGSDGDDGDDGSDGDDGDDGSDGDDGDDESGSSGGGGGGAARPIELSLHDVEAPNESVEPGETVTVSFTVRNEDDRSGVRDLELADGLTVLDTDTVALTPDEERRLTFEGSLDAVGTHEFTVDGTDVATIEVVESGDDGVPGGSVGSGESRTDDVRLADVSLASERIRTGEPVVVEATFENTGSGEATTRANVSMFGEVVAVERVTVPAGGEETLRVERTVDAAGNYSVGVAGQERSVEVRPADAEADGESDESAGSDGTLPTVWLLTGFAAMVGLLTVLGRYR